MFWCLAPFLLAFLAMPLLLEPPKTLLAGACIVVLEVMAACALLGFYDSVRFHWCWRVVGALVFVLYVAYLVMMMAEGAWIVGERGSATSAVGAVLGLFAFGLPGLCYALTGRLTWHSDADDVAWDGWEDDDDCFEEDEKP
jgi:hypothetical protein